MTTLWMNGSKPVWTEGVKRIIGKKPLIDLVELQRMLHSGELDLGKDEQVDVATNECWEKMKALKWTAGKQVAEFIKLLKPETFPKGDFRNAQWCQDSEEDWHPCDSYAARVDDKTWTRDPNAPMYYIKFSVDDAGTLFLVLISCHLDSHKV